MVRRRKKRVRKSYRAHMRARIRAAGYAVPANLLPRRRRRKSKVQRKVRRAHMLFKGKCTLCGRRSGARSSTKMYCTKCQGVRRRRGESTTVVGLD